MGALDDWLADDYLAIAAYHRAGGATATITRTVADLSRLTSAHGARLPVRARGPLRRRVTAERRLDASTVSSGETGAGTTPGRRSSWSRATVANLLALSPNTGPDGHSRRLPGSATRESSVTTSDGCPAAHRRRLGHHVARPIGGGPVDDRLGAAATFMLLPRFGSRWIGRARPRGERRPRVDRSRARRRPEPPTTRTLSRRSVGEWSFAGVRPHQIGPRRGASTK